MSIRCQRELILTSQRLKTNEVLEVMIEHDLMDLLRAKVDGDLDQLTITLTSSANIAGRSRIYSSRQFEGIKKPFYFEPEEPPPRDDRAESTGSTSLDLIPFPNIGLVSSTDEIDLPNEDLEADESKNNSNNSNNQGNGNGLGLFSGISAIMSMRRLSNKNRNSDKEDTFTDIRGSNSSPSANGQHPEKKSFLQRAFGFISNDSNSNTISDPEDEDVETGFFGNRSSRRNSSKYNSSTSPTSPSSIQQQQSQSQQQSQQQQPPPQPPPPPPKNILTDISPPRPHTTNPISPKNYAKNNNIQKQQQQQPPQENQSNEEIKRRNSISTSRQLANEAMNAVKARNISLNEKVQNSKNNSNQNTNLSYDNIYPSERSMTGSEDEVVIEATNDQLIGLTRHRESELQRISMISKTTNQNNSDHDSEDEKIDFFESNIHNSNPLRQSRGSQNNKITSTNLRGLLAQPTTTTTTAATSSSSLSNTIPNFENIPPDHSALALEKRRRSTRFPSIKGKREMFLLRSETGSSVSSTSSNSGSIQQPSINTRKSGVSGQSNNDQTTGNSSGGMSGISQTSPVTVETALSRRVSRKFVSAASNVEDFNEQVNKYYTYKELKRDPVKKDSPNEEMPSKFPSDVNPKHREQYLTDTEFEAIFNMSKSTFNSQPKWKRQELKKQHLLF